MSLILTCCLTATALCVLTCFSHLTDPFPPRKATITRVLQNGVELNWLPPTDPNGEVHYVIEYKREDSGNWTSDNTTIYNLTGLHSGTNYTIRVVAVDSAGRVSTISTSSSTATPISGSTATPTSSSTVTPTSNSTATPTSNSMS